MMSHIVVPEEWTAQIIDATLIYGDTLYRKSLEARNVERIQAFPGQQVLSHLTCHELLRTARIFGETITVSFGESTGGNIEFDQSHLGLPNLQTFLRSFAGDNTAVLSGILFCSGQTIAHMKRGGVFYVFDSHARGSLGQSCDAGRACLVGTVHYDTFEQVIRSNIRVTRDINNLPGAQYEFVPVSVAIENAKNTTEIVPEMDEEGITEEDQEPPEGITLDTEYKSIVNMKLVWNRTKEAYMLHRNTQGCDIADFNLDHTTQVGLEMKFHFKCANCGVCMSVPSAQSDQAKSLDLNASAVTACLTTGIGFFQMEEFLAVLNIKCMSNDLYQKKLDEMRPLIIGAAEASMAQAALEQQEIARKAGNVIGNTPFNSVEGDGQFMKRSYIHSGYDSPAACIVVIGSATKKILQIVVKQKTCSICDRAAAREQEPPPHKCSRNHGANRSSTSMESTGMGEAFEQRIEKSGLVYKILVSDGDSANIKEILDRNPYAAQGVQVKNLLCVNHIKRNIGSNIKGFANARGQDFGALKNQILDRILPIIRSLEDAVVKARILTCSDSEKQKALRASIGKIIPLVFGDHGQCADALFGCDGPKEREENLMGKLVSKQAHLSLEKILHRAQENAESLLADLTTNTTEGFNSQIAKTTGGKRINYALRFSYLTRCHLSVLTHNEGQSIAPICKFGSLKVPELGMHLQMRRRQEVMAQALRNVGREQVRDERRAEVVVDRYYGLYALVPDKDEAQLQQLREEHFETLRDWMRDREAIEQRTRDQDVSGEWMTKKRWLITASKAHAILRKRPNTSCAVIVRTIMYPKVLDNNPATQHGIQHEKFAKIALQSQGLVIEPCGLVLDPEIPGIDGRGVLEIKCPYKGRDMLAREAATDKSCPISNALTWLQMRVTGLHHGFFVIYTLKGLIMVPVLRDDIFINELLSKLSTFYNECMVPEIIDSRRKRGLPIKDPQSIIDAQNAKKRSGKGGQTGHDDGSTEIAETGTPAMNDEMDLDSIVATQEGSIGVCESSQNPHSAGRNAEDEGEPEDTFEMTQGTSVRSSTRNTLTAYSDAEFGNMTQCVGEECPIIQAIDQDLFVEGYYEECYTIEVIGALDEPE